MIKILLILFVLTKFSQSNDIVIDTSQYYTYYCKSDVISPDTSMIYNIDIYVHDYTLDFMNRYKRGYTSDNIIYQYMIEYIKNRGNDKVLSENNDKINQYMVEFIKTQKDKDMPNEDKSNEDMSNEDKSEKCILNVPEYTCDIYKVSYFYHVYSILDKCEYVGCDNV